jgi:hypothetical protein
VQDTQAQQIKLGSSKHLPFDQFQAIHLSFHLTITPRRREGRTYRRADLLFSLSETSSIQASHEKVPEPM